MKKIAHCIVFFLSIATAFLVGSWYKAHSANKINQTSARKVLYYVDPMHPSYRSDRPGIAPDCGMDLVPVYADQGPVEPGAKSISLSAGTVNVSEQKQQLIGVRVSQVEKAQGSYRLRLLGRVAADETRIYKLNAGIDGFIQDVSAATTGSQVKKGAVLATFSAPNATMPIQTYLLNLGAEERLTKAAAEGTPEAQSLPAANANIQQRTQQLQNLGMSLQQMQEIRRTRQIPATIKILAPSDGFVLARNVSPGLKFERGAEFYRMADLKRVWILADVFEQEAQYVRPGLRALVSLPQQGKKLVAKVSEILPQFDASTQTLKVRFEVDNRGYMLRPDMFVDVQLSISFPPTIAVPVDAVLDSGIKKTVFVDRGQGFFEPREVQTGWHFDDRVQIVQGLRPGEQIVVAGNFLISSESRLQAAVAGMVSPANQVERAVGANIAPAETESSRTKDPACGMEVRQADALAAGHTSKYRDKTYYFCSDSCQRKFDRKADEYLKNLASPRGEQRPGNATGRERGPMFAGGRRG